MFQAGTQCLLVKIWGAERKCQWTKQGINFFLQKSILWCLCNRFARFDVFKLGVSGLEKSAKEDAQTALAIRWFG